MKYGNTIFPAQKVPLKKKNKEWGEACVDYIIGMGETVPAGSDKTSFEEMQTYYDLYNSVFNEADLKYVTNPFNQDDGFPASPQNFNIIKSKIDLLLGEETNQPYNFKVIRTSQDAASDIQDKMKKLMTDYIMATVTSGMSEKDSQEYQDRIASGEIMPPEKIMSFISKDYKDVAEESAYHSINYLKEKLGLDHEYSKGWKDALIAGKEVFYTGVLNGEPHQERVNPLYFSHDTSPDNEFIENGDWACRRLRMSYTEVYDRLYDKMSEKQLDDLLELTGETKNSGRYGNQTDSMMDYNHFEMTNVTANGSDDINNSTQVNLWHATWKSYKKIGFVKIVDEIGEIQEITVSEDYLVIGNELNIDWKWVIEVWEGYRIGENIYVGIQPLEYQFVSADNMNSQKLPYSGVIYSNTNSKSKSLVAIMKPLQYMYIIIWYRLELALARDKGKVITMDITQIPKSMNIDPAKWMHYLSAVGVNFINPYECFTPGTKVIMGDGSIKNIEDIKIGESVMGQDGTPRKVLSVHNGVDNMYRIKHRSGAKDQVVNSVHKIYYYEKNYFKNSFDSKLENSIDLLFEEENISYKSNVRYTKRASNIDLNWNNEVELDPYFLGLWLGDGTKNKVEITNIDTEIASYLYEYAQENGLKISEAYTHDYSGVKVYRIFNGAGIKNPIKDILLKYGILNDKKIPKEYIYTSRENRLKLLAGLIDTDGCFHKRDNIYTFSQSLDKSHIVDDAAFIARSLGFKCTVNTYGIDHEKYIMDSDNISICQPTRSLSILDWDIEIPTKIERKQSPIVNKRGDKDYSNFKIEYEGVGEFYGIHIDGDHLFLLDDFTIVHNTGFDIPGRDGGHPAGFNQIAALDLTMAQVIDQYINLMAKIEDMVSDISGVSRQREGSIQASELVGNVQQATNNSSNITAPLVWMHNQAKKNALRMLLNTAKETWKDSKRTNIQYVLNDSTRTFLTLSDNFFYEDYDIFISNSSKDLRNLEMIKSLYQPAMQNGTSILDIAEIMTLDNITMIKNKLGEIEQVKSERDKSIADQENQRQIQLAQAQNEVKQEENSLKQQELDLSKYKTDSDNQTKIYVAELNAYRGQQDLDADNNGIPDVMEIADLSLRQNQLASDEMDKQIARSQKDREIQLKQSIEKKKIDSQNENEKRKDAIEREKITLEHKKISAQKELQSMKDKSMLDRERIKSRTLLKNKVVGEK
jgi:hypothetical protein